MEKKCIKNIILIIFLLIFYINNKYEFCIKKKKIINKPKISVIIPVYNGEKYLNYSLSSVLNQTMKDIEIIIIDDNSKDNSLKIIKNYMKYDQRINLIENKENRKILFCKSFGALNSKGKYIIELDQDDLFLRKDAFDIIYNETEINHLDLLRFKSISGNDTFNLPKFDNIKRIAIIENQPKLKYSIFKTNICLLWGNLIKTNLYKIIIYNLWPIIINYKIIFQEDFLITFFMLIYARKFKRINDILYFHLIHKKQTSNNHKNNSEYYLSVIFAGIIFYDYYINLYSKDIKIIINYIDFLKFDFIKIKKKYPLLFFYFFEKILTNNQLLKEDKKDLIKFYNISDNYHFYKYLNLNKVFSFKNLSFQQKYKYNNTIKILKISIIIVVSKYGQVKNLINSINSQTFKFFEIILIYDNEKKEDYLLLSKYIELFNNINLINNKRRKGIIYSIFKGVKIANGKYLMILDPHSIFLEMSAFEEINKEFEKEDFDILEFNLYNIFPNNYIYLYKCKHYDSQFNLTQLKYNLEFNDIDIKHELLTNKIFKNKFFKTIINKFRNTKVNDIIKFYYNNIFSFIIDSTHHKFKRSNKINIYIKDTDCDKFKFHTFNNVNQILIDDTINYIDFIFSNSNNTYQSKQKVLKEYFNVLSIMFNTFTNISDLSFQLLNKFINCKYISKTNKTLLNFYIKSLLN